MSPGSTPETDQSNTSQIFCINNLELFWPKAVLSTKRCKLLRNDKISKIPQNLKCDYKNL